MATQRSGDVVTKVEETLVTTRLAELLPHFDLFDEEHADRLFEVLEYSRDNCPVFATDADGGYYLVTRYDDVRFVLENPELFSSRQPGVRGVPVRLPPLDEDPPLHKDYRQLLNKYFSRKFLLNYEPVLRDLAKDVIAKWIDNGECEFVHDFAIPFTAGSLARVVLDEDDEDRVQRAVTAVTRTGVEGTPETFIAVAELAAEFMASRDVEGTVRDDVLSGLVNGTIDDRPLTMEERLGVVTVLFLGGLDTTRGAIANIGYHLATDPNIEARLRTPGWDARDIDEFVRFESTVSFMARTVTEDTEVGGCPMNKGDRLAVNYQSANRDPRKFDKPDVLQFNREVNPHLAFGAGVHRCLGLNFARIQLSVAFDELLKQVTNLRLKEGTTISRSVGVSAGAPKRLEIVFDKV